MAAQTPPSSFRKRRKQRITAPTLRLHRSGGLQGRHRHFVNEGSSVSQHRPCAYTVAAAICRHRHFVNAESSASQHQPYAYAVAAAFKAAMGDAYTQKTALYASPVRIRDALWRQIAAATESRIARSFRNHIALCIAYGGVDAAATKYNQCCTTVAAAICRHRHFVNEGSCASPHRPCAYTAAAAFKAAMGDAYTQIIPSYGSRTASYHRRGGLTAAAPLPILRCRTVPG